MPDATVVPFLSTNQSTPSPPPVSSSAKPPVTETLPEMGLFHWMNVIRVDAGSMSVPGGAVPVTTQASGVLNSRLAECQQSSEMLEVCVNCG
jgi:hypothetical protein